MLHYKETKAHKSDLSFPFHIRIYPMNHALFSQYIPSSKGLLHKGEILLIIPLPDLAKQKPQTTPPRPPKLLNRGEVVRQVSHCGKPQRTGSQPLGCFLNLPEGLCPLGTPSEVSYLCTPWHTKCFQIFRKVHRTFLHIFHHFAKGLLAPCIPRQRFHPCNLVIIYYIQCNTLCNK